ncbi:MAG: hypothetical protein QHC40_03885 [Sphingobium sp.]|nr:hypothetical protein [Sphingobium sp.]
MAEPKPLASLTPGLLARKGAAVPAMRRQMLTGFGGAPTGFQDDLGWNDMGHGAGSAPAPVPADPLPLSGLTPMSASSPPVPSPVPPVVTERAQLAEKVAAAATPPQVDAPVAGPAPRPAGAGRKAAFTLRLDAQRHLKLRLACAVQHRSAQQIVSDALDQFLDGLPEIDRLADQLPRDRGEI